MKTDRCTLGIGALLMAMVLVSWLFTQRFDAAMAITLMLGALAFIADRLEVYLDH